MARTLMAYQCRYAVHLDMNAYMHTYAVVYGQSSETDGLTPEYLMQRMQADVDGEGAGNEVPLVPAVVATGQVWWQPWERLRLRLIHRYVDDRYQGGDFANEFKVDAYQLVDARAEYRVSPNCRVFVKGDNLFDERYAESVYSGTYYPGPGRSVQAGVRLSF